MFCLSTFWSKYNLRASFFILVFLENWTTSKYKFALKPKAMNLPLFTSEDILYGVLFSTILLPFCKMNGHWRVVPGASSKFALRLIKQSIISHHRSLLFITGSNCPSLWMKLWGGKATMWWLSLKRAAAFSAVIPKDHWVGTLVVQHDQWQKLGLSRPKSRPKTAVHWAEGPEASGICQGRQETQFWKQLWEVKGVST